MQHDSNSREIGFCHFFKKLLEFSNTNPRSNTISTYQIVSLIFTNSLIPGTKRDRKKSVCLSRWLLMATEGL